MRTIILTMAFGSFLATGCENASSGVAIPPSTKRAGARTGEPVSCTLKCKPNCILGQVPEVEVRLTNETADDIYLVGSLDGSEDMWRYPLCVFEVTCPNGERLGEGRSRCANMNTLREKDFVKVLPGESFDPFQILDTWGFGGPTFDKSQFDVVGDYKVRFRYSTLSTDFKLWQHWDSPQNPQDQRIKSLFPYVPQVEVRSNTVTVRVFSPET